MSRREDAPRDEGYDDWLDAVAAGEAFYLECPEGHGRLPPRRVCPACGSTDLETRPLPETGVVETLTTVHVAGPNFADDAPYATAIASFGPVRLTGVLRGIDPEEVTTAIGESGEATREGEAATRQGEEATGQGEEETATAVEAAVGESETTGERLLVLRAR